MQKKMVISGVWLLSDRLCGGSDLLRSSAFFRFVRKRHDGIGDLPCIGISVDRSGNLLAVATVSSDAGVSAGDLHEQPDCFIHGQFCNQLSGFYILLLQCAEQNPLYPAVCHCFSFLTIGQKRSLVVLEPVFSLYSGLGLVYEYNGNCSDLSDY